MMFYNDAVGTSEYIDVVLNGKIIRDNKWVEISVFEVLIWHLSQGTEEDHANLRK
jgi:hypothetical protein